MESDEMDMDESFTSASTKSSSSSSSSNINNNNKLKEHKSNKKRKNKKNNKKKNKKSTDQQQKKKKTEPTKRKRRKKKKKVRFSTIQVLEFTYTLGHQSVTEKGPPVSLSYDLVRSHHHDVDSYETSKSVQTIFTNNNNDDDDGELSPEERWQILFEEGFSHADIEQADQESKWVRMQRNQSVLQMPWDVWYERKERIHRRMKRWTNPRNIISIRGKSHLIHGSATIDNHNHKNNNAILAF
jgi:hypothetical protein